MLIHSARRVVVTGIGIIAPNGIGYRQFWQHSFAGVSGIKSLTFNTEFSCGSTVGAPVTTFTTQMGGDAGGRHVQFALAASQMALHTAGVVPMTLDPTRMGICIANAIAGTPDMETAFLHMTQQGKQAIDAKLTPHALFYASTFHVVSSEIAACYNAQGPCITLPTGCVAGIDALGFALDSIRSEACDLMLAGATEAPLTPMVMAAFDAIGALSRRYNATPQHASRPYDQHRDGFVLGEGCGILLLEEYQHARARGAPIFAEICGYGSTANAYHMTGLPEDGHDLATAMMIALDDAKLPVTAIDYINAHGSATRQNDINETAAYKKVFAQRAYHIPISALKSLCGHALAAANTIEIIATIGCLVQQRLHPTLNLLFPDPVCDLDYVPLHARTAQLQYAIKTASGFSGIHSAMVLGRM